MSFNRGKENDGRRTTVSDCELLLKKKKSDLFPSFLAGHKKPFVILQRGACNFIKVVPLEV